MAASGRAVLIVGGQGVLGTALTRASEAEGCNVRLGGRRADSSLGVTLVDLDRPETVAEALSGVDVAVNTVPDPRLTPERAVLARGGVLVDVSARPYRQARELREEASEARGLVVTNGGRTPGVSNLVAADLLVANPDADAVEVVFTLSVSGASGAAGGAFLHRNLTTKARHRTEVVPFPEPLGPRRCVEFAEPERAWLGGLADGRDASGYVCFVQRGANRVLLGLNRLGVMRRLPAAAFVKRGRVDPDATNRDPVREWVAVRRGGERLAARTIEGDGGYPMTAAATLAVVEALLASDAAPRAGCFDVHELLELEAVSRGLAARGVNVVPQP